MHQNIVCNRFRSETGVYHPYKLKSFKCKTKQPLIYKIKLSCTMCAQACLVRSQVHPLFIIV